MEISSSEKQVSKRDKADQQQLHLNKGYLRESYLNDLGYIVLKNILVNLMKYVTR